MSTISYKCDTCKREIELIENIQGMTVFSKCVITEGCKGKLYATDRNPDSIRERLPSDLSPLEDYTPRRTFFEFNQNILSDTWKIQHNMSVFPAVTVYVDIDGVIMELAADDYTINLISNNNLEITFPAPTKGVVHLVARSSVPLKPSTQLEPDDLFQVSHDGIMTVAVPKYIIHSSTSLPVDLQNVSIEIEICLEIPDREPIVCIEQFPPELDSDSPWVGWDEILVRKRRNFYPRTKKILDLNVFEDSTFTLDDIEDGTILTFKRVNFGDGVYRNIESRALLMLLAKKPFEPFDKILDNVIDIGELSSETPDFLIFSEGDLYSGNTAIERIYPDISRIQTVGFVPTPTPSPTPTVTVTPSPSPTVPVTPSVTPTISVTPTVTPTISITPSVTDTPKPSPTPSPTISVTPTVTPTISVTPTVTPTISVTPSVSVSPAPSCIDLTTVYSAVEGDTSGVPQSTFTIPITYSSKPGQSSLFTWDLTSLPSLPSGSFSWRLTVTNSNLEGTAAIKFNRQANGSADYTQPIFGDGVVNVGTPFDFTTLTSLSIENTVVGPQVLGDSFDFTIEINCP